MDYMIDLPWLLSSCPDLRQAERVGGSIEDVTLHCSTVQGLPVSCC